MNVRVVNGSVRACNEFLLCVLSESFAIFAISAFVAMS